MWSETRVRRGVDVFGFLLWLGVGPGWKNQILSVPRARGSVGILIILPSSWAKGKGRDRDFNDVIGQLAPGGSGASAGPFLGGAVSRDGWL